MKSNRQLFVLLAVALVAPACGRRASLVSEASRAGVLHMSTGGEPSELDPHVINSPPDFRVIHAFFEGLTQCDRHTGEPRPAAAERWSVSDDGLTYTFHLRANARWSNGDALTAEDFLFSFRRALSPSLGSQYTVLFNPVRGAEEYAAGKQKDFAHVGFAAPNPQTLEIKLARPTPYFLALLTGNPVWFPVHRATVEARGKFDQRGNDWTRAGRLVGNGPFTLKEWRPNQAIVGEKSATYWDAANVRLRGIHFHPIDSIDAEERGFRAGQLHITRSVPQSRIATYRAEKTPALLLRPMLNARFINVNTSRPALADPRIRRALSMALERSVYSTKVLGGTEAAAFQVVPNGMPGYTPATLITEDLAAARELLAAAGFPNGRGFPALTFSKPTGGASDLAQAIQQSWRKGLGIEVQIQETESRTHWSNMQLKQYDLGVAGWIADYPDASTYLDVFVTKGGWNLTGWADARYDELIALSASELDPTKRLRHLQAAEAHLLEAMPVIPLTFPLSRMLVHSSVRDWADNALDRPNFPSVWLAAD